MNEAVNLARDGQAPDAALLAALEARYAGLEGEALLRPLIEREFRGRIALVSSFGAEAVVLLDLVASIDPYTPVIFLDTGKHFPETLAYRDRAVARLGLKDVRTVHPSPLDLDAEDPTGTLWQRDPDRCCYLRKVLPLESALRDFDAWINGRKRYHGEAREKLGSLELTDGKIKINPLANWTASDIARVFAERDLPPHPLVAEGYRSIGCAPCTSKTASGQGARSGRWSGSLKTECGIHQPHQRNNS